MIISPFFILTCDTRPFQISAFFFNPHGPCPSLKFQRRPAKAVVVEDVAVGVGTEKGLRETTAFREVLLGDTKAEEQANRAVTRNRMDLVVNIIILIKYFNASVQVVCFVSLLRIRLVSCQEVKHHRPESSSSSNIISLFLSRVLFLSDKVLVRHCPPSNISRTSRSEIGNFPPSLTSKSVLFCSNTKSASLRNFGAQNGEADVDITD
jgi:hypothetical protein